MHRTVVIVECFEFEAHARFLRDKLVWPGTNRLLQKPLLPHLLIVFRRHGPAGTADITGAEQNWKVQKRLFEMKLDRVVVDELDPLGPFVENFTPGAAVMLVTPFDVLGRDRRAVV